MTSAPVFRLVSSTGGRHFDLPLGVTLVLGRGLGSDMPIHDPTISRRHAELTAGTDGVEVKDLNSSNGTFINGKRVAAAPLAVGETITFGKVQFQLRDLRLPADLPLDLASDHPSQGGGEIVRQVSVEGRIAADLASLDLGGRALPPDPSQLLLTATSADDRQAKKLSLLLDIWQKLSGEFDLDRLLRTVVDTTFEILNVDRVSILLIDERTGALTPTISRNRFGDTQLQDVPRSIAHKVIEEQVAVVSHNAPADARFKSQSIVFQSVRSAMCSPLMASADRVLGLLYVDNLTTSNTFSDEDLQFLVAFSGVAAMAIKNSHYAEQLRREATVRSNFERYFAPNVAAEIAQHDEAARAGGERRPISILFSDIRGFTAMAEGMGPDAIADLLTDYFSEMVEVVFEHGGTLDKFIGDAVMALWGAPIAHDDDPNRALRAALAMQETIADLNRRWAAQGRPELGVGIGLSHGDVFAGNIGSHRRLEYTVIGDAVNVAARLCAEAGPGEILVSESFCQVVRAPVDYEYLPEIAIKGKARVVQVFKVKGIAP